MGKFIRGKIFWSGPQARIPSATMGKSFQWARTSDSRVLLLQTMYIRLAMVACEQLPPPPPVPVPRQETKGSREFPRQLLVGVGRSQFDGHVSQRFSVLQSCPHHVRGGSFRPAGTLEARHVAVGANDPVMEERAWKLFCLLPVWLLRRSPGDARVSKEDLCRRFDLFAEGHWDTLCDEAVAAITNSPPQREHHERTMEERAMAACRKVQLGGEKCPELDSVSPVPLWHRETPTR